MGLFGSAKSSDTQGVRVTLAPGKRGATVVSVNGVVYGAVSSEDGIILNSELPDDVKLRGEALAALTLVMMGNGPDRVSKAIADIRKLPTLE